jgi:hypothetical protein
MQKLTSLGWYGPAKRRLRATVAHPLLEMRNSSATSGSGSGASNRLTAAVRRRTAAKGNSTTFVLPAFTKEFAALTR